MWRNILSQWKNCRKVKGHCHFTGIHRGAAHCIWNLKYNVPKEVPLISHNVSNYDFHLMVRHMSKKSKENEVNCLAKNTEKYLRFLLD